MSTISLLDTRPAAPAEEAGATPFGRARRAMQARYLAELPARFDAPVLPIPMLAHEVRGLELLAELGERLYGAGMTAESER